MGWIGLMRPEGFGIVPKAGICAGFMFVYSIPIRRRQSTIGRVVGTRSHIRRLCGLIENAQTRIGASQRIENVAIAGELCSRLGCVLYCLFSVVIGTSSDSVEPSQIIC